MKISYKTITAPTTQSGNVSFRTIHIVIVDAETLTTTRAKEVLKFVKDRNPDKFTWRELKNAVRLQQSFTSN